MSGTPLRRRLHALSGPDRVLAVLVAANGPLTASEVRALVPAWVNASGALGSLERSGRVEVLPDVRPLRFGVRAECLA